MEVNLRKEAIQVPDPTRVRRWLTVNKKLIIQVKRPQLNRESLIKSSKMLSKETLKMTKR